MGPVQIKPHAGASWAPQKHIGQRMQQYLRWRRRNKQDAKLVKAQNSMPTL